MTKGPVTCCLMKFQPIRTSPGSPPYGPYDKSGLATALYTPTDS
jgi:hypothetical protein